MKLRLGGLYWFCKGCGVRVGFQPFLGHDAGSPFWHKRPQDYRPRPYCENCYKGFSVVHLGQGIFVRPRQENDNVPVKGPNLEGLYS